MSKRERLRRWRQLLAELDLTVVAATERLGVSVQTGYNWSSGIQPIPPARLKQLEQMLRQ